MNDTDTVTTNSVGEMEPPQFTLPVKDGYAPPNKTRGRKGTSIKMEEMIQPQDQALLEWKQIEFFVPVKKPAQSVLAHQANNLLSEDSERLMANDSGLPHPVHI